MHLCRMHSCKYSSMQLCNKFVHVCDLTQPLSKPVSKLAFHTANDRIGHDCDILNVKPSFLRNNVKFSEIREDDRWRVNILKEIVNINQNVLDLKHAFLSSEQLNEILEYVSIS